MPDGELVTFGYVSVVYVYRFCSKVEVHRQMGHTHAYKHCIKRFSHLSQY
jgi:uncharacterized ion transporter superfamily protein YfcC